MAVMGAPERRSVAVSVVMPVTERYHSVVEVYQAYSEVLKKSGYSFEFIVVIDGGLDTVVSEFERLIALGEPIQVAVLPRGFGEATALTVGFEQARAELIVTLPAYFQTIPEGIHTVLERLNEGYDLVVGRRWPRKDSWVNRIQNYVFHFIIRHLTGVTFRDMSCGLRGIRKRVVQEVQLYGDLHRFFPMLAVQRGFRVVEENIPQHHTDCGPRIYHPGVYLRRLLDILTMVFLVKFTRKPLRFFGLVGVGLFGGGFLISIVLAGQQLLGMTALADRPLLILGVLLMVLGVQTGSIGLLGEIIIFTHARKMKEYTIDRVLK